MPTFLAIGKNCWAKGPTPADAVAKASEVGGTSARRNHMILLVDKEATVDGMGMINTPWGSMPPVELYRVFDGKQCPAGTTREVTRGGKP